MSWKYQLNLIAWLCYLASMLPYWFPVWRSCLLVLVGCKTLLLLLYSCHFLLLCLLVLGAPILGVYNGFLLSFFWVLFFFVFVNHCMFLTCGYPCFQVCWPIITSTCFRLVVFWRRSALGFLWKEWGLACCDSWGRKESDTTEQLNWTEYKLKHMLKKFYNFLLLSSYFVILVYDFTSSCLSFPFAVHSSYNCFHKNFFCLSRGGEVWWAAIYGVTQS